MGDFVNAIQAGPGLTVAFSQVNATLFVMGAKAPRHVTASDALKTPEKTTREAASASPTGTENSVLDMLEPAV
jgi:hypothetical protein